MSGSEPESEFIIVGKITGAHGIRGWVKVHSYTEPNTNILNFDPIYLKSSESKLSQPEQSEDWQPVKISDGRPQGRGIVMQLDHITDRNQAEELGKRDIAIKSGQLPETEEGLS